MTAVVIAAPAPVFVDRSQGTPGAPSPTGGIMTVQGQTGTYPLSVVAGVTGPIGPVGITGPVAMTGLVGVNNFPSVQGVTGAVGVVGPVGVTGTVLAIGAATEATVSKRFSGGKNTGALEISSSGDNVIYTPATGKTLTLYWIALGTPDTNLATTKATVKLGTKVVYIWPLPAPGAFSHWEPVTANNPNDALIVNLTSAQTVEVNFTTTEA